MNLRLSDLLLACMFLVSVCLMLLCTLASRNAQGNTIASLEQAIRLTPWSAEYRERLAFLYAREQRTADAKAQLTQALDLEPVRASAMLELARMAEAESDLPGAERWLQRAARVDRQFDPSWALANFYLRVGNQARFWEWLSRAYAVSRRDTDPIWQLASRVEPDASAVLRHLNVREPVRLREYLRYLREAGDRDNALVLVEHLSALQSGDRETLLWLCDGFLSQDKHGPAEALWLRLRNAKLAPGSESLNLLINPDFQTAPLGRCFDWRLPPQIDVTTTFGGRGIAQFSLAGRQQMDVVLAEQFVPVEGGGLYEFCWSARLDAVGAGAGLLWDVAANAAAILVESPQLDSADWRSGCFRFRAPSGARVCNLRLRYKRREGSMRVEGDLYVKDLKMRKL